MSDTLLAQCLQLVAAVKAGDVDGVNKCLQHEKVDLEEAVEGHKAVEWLVHDNCRADLQQRVQIAALLQHAGAIVTTNLIVRHRKRSD